MFCFLDKNLANCCTKVHSHVLSVSLFSSSRFCGFIYLVLKNKKIADQKAWFLDVALFTFSSVQMEDMNFYFCGVFFKWQEVNDRC